MLLAGRKMAIQVLMKMPNSQQLQAVLVLLSLSRSRLHDRNLPVLAVVGAPASSPVLRAVQSRQAPKLQVLQASRSLVHLLRHHVVVDHSQQRALHVRVCRLARMPSELTPSLFLGLLADKARRRLAVVQLIAMSQFVQRTHHPSLRHLPEETKPWEVHLQKSVQRRITKDLVPLLLQLVVMVLAPLLLQVVLLRQAMLLQLQLHQTLELLTRLRDRHLKTNPQLPKNAQRIMYLL